MNTPRWTSITPSQFPWEEQALDFLRRGLPDHEPLRAWSNFEFVTPEGQIYEVDLLVLTKVGFWLVEIKSRPGIVAGDTHSWTWTSTDGRRVTHDNPYLLANRKAKALASLLRSKDAARKLKAPFPFLEAVVFLSDPAVELKLQGAAAAHVFLRDRGPDDSGGARPGILAALLRREGPGLEPMPRTLIDAPTARALGRALDEAGIRPSRKARRVGDYVLGEMLGEGPGYQDFAAEHASLKGVHVRVRRYLAAAASQEDREHLRRAAERELRVLHALDHPGILEALDLREDELGPALLFKHDPGHTRLDHHLAALAREGKALTVDQRLGILRQAADAVRYAHTRGVIHRALGPESILLTGLSTCAPGVKLFNWQVSVREQRSDSSRLTHVEDLVESSTHVYMAPEAFATSAEVTRAADVFSLGALAYLLFSGKPPAPSRAVLNDVLREHGGLKVAALVDGAGPALDALIYVSTCPAVDQRTSNVEELLEVLDEVEEELTRPEPRLTIDPLQAKRGDELEHGWVVERVLGKGSTALALLVKKAGEGTERVLKVALEPADNARLVEEAKALRAVRSEYIVALEDELDFGPRRALVLRKAGDDTLAAYLAKEGRLSLDLLERFGDNLLEAVASLERAGVPHRDIKPDNIGVSSPRKQSYHLVLFDFSLAGAPLESIHLGTPQYRDPFLELRKPRRWDPAADRFSAAVTLFEMATGSGSYPRWGDGRSDPAVTQAPLALDANQFEASTRDGLKQFFDRALARDAASRFADAGEMKQAWMEIFRRAASVSRPAADVEPDAPLPLDLDGAQLDTPVAAIGLSTRAVNALDRIEVRSVRDLASLSLQRVLVLSGVGQKTRLEIRTAVSRAREKFPSVLAAPDSAPASGPSGDPAPSLTVEASFDSAGVADLCHRFLGPRPAESQGKAARGGKAWQLAAALLGLGERHPEPGDWPTQSQVARENGVDPAQVSMALSRLRTRWLEKEPWMSRLRDEVLGHLQAAGGVATARELAGAVLAARPAGLEVDRSALAMASGVARAAVEAEQGAAEPRFVVVRDPSRAKESAPARVLVALSEPLAAWALRLGEVADDIAAEDPLPSPVRAVARLRDVTLSDATSTDPVARPAAMSDDRLLRLAAAASRTAALSPRGELYPRGLDAGRALVLARGAVAGLGLGDPAQDGNCFRPEDVEARVRSRYPAAGPLPSRQELDLLLDQLGLDAAWDESSGRYRRRQHQPLPTEGSSIVDPWPPGRTSRRHTPQSAEAAVVRSFEERLRGSLRQGGFLVLRTGAPTARACEKQLERRLDVERVSCDRLLLDALRAAAAGAGVAWNVVLDADRAGPGSQDWENLLQLVAEAIADVERDLLGRTEPVLLVHLGLLRRYGQIGLLERLRDQAGRRDVCPAVWILNVEDEQSDLPRLDGEEIPLTSPGEQVRVPAEWFDVEKPGEVVTA